MRLDLVDGIATDGKRGFHHQAGIAQHFLLGVVQQYAIRNPGAQGESEAENRHQHDIEFGLNAHFRPRSIQSQ